MSDETPTPTEASDALEAVNDYIKTRLRESYRTRMLEALPEVIEAEGMTELVSPMQVLAAFYADNPQWNPDQPASRPPVDGDATDEPDAWIDGCPPGCSPAQCATTPSRHCCLADDNDPPPRPPVDEEGPAER